MRTAGRALATVLIAGSAATALDAAPPSRPVALYVSTTDDAVPAEASPPPDRRPCVAPRTSGSASWPPLRKTSEVVIVNDEASADASLEIREAAVQEARATEDTRRLVPGRPAGATSGGITTAGTDVAVNQVRDRDDALTVRVSTAHFFADCSSDPRDTSAASAVGTVMGKLKQWIGAHHRELILPRTP